MIACQLVAIQMLSLVANTAVNTLPDAVQSALLYMCLGTSPYFDTMNGSGANDAYYYQHSRQESIHEYPVRKWSETCKMDLSYSFSFPSHA